MIRRVVVLTAVACAATACSSVSTGNPASAPRTNPSRSAAASGSTPSATADRPPSHPTRSTARTHGTPRATSSRPVPPSSGTDPQRVLAAMTEKERVGQLLMVDCPTTGVAGATVTAISNYHVGSVILDGTTYQGLAATKAVTSRLQGLAPAATKLLISTDQEGGQVQRLQGAGFSTIPSALQQGSWYGSELTAAATTWARQLHAAGINVNLGPVMDTVPAGDTNNPPIGDLDREFGHDTSVVSMHGVAFLKGMAQGGVDATAKHFPGLGRVTGNTDTTSGVRDTVTGPSDPYLAPFQAAVQAQVPLVMMSTAIYTRIDPHNPAAFSRTIVTGILRDRLRFGGVVISDDLGQASQVSGRSVGSRAVDFIRAGGDLVLTVNAAQAPAMTSALLSEASSSSSFRSLIDQAALRVLNAKSALGLLH